MLKNKTFQKRKIFNICNIYILLWCLYNFHWHSTGAIPALEVFSNVILAINLTISIVCAVIVLNQKTYPNIFKSITILVLLFTFYGVFSIIQDESIYIRFSGTKISNGSYLIGALRTFLPIYTFYYFARRGLLTTQAIRFWTWIFFAQSIYFYMIWRMNHMLVSIDMLLTNGTSYLFVSLLPLVFFFRKNIIQYSLIGLVIFAVLLSVKRGAILTTAIGVSFFLMLKLKNATGKRRLFVLILTFIVIAITSNIVSNLSRNDMFQSRLEETISGDDSGRSEISAELLNAYLNQSTAKEFLFGFGADGTLKISFNYAHNDWLEMLVDQGLLGFCFYLLFWLILFKVWRKSKRNELCYSVFGMIFLIGIFETFFSMWYSNTDVFTTLPLGYCIAMISLKGSNSNEFVLQKNSLIGQDSV